MKGAEILFKKKKAENFPNLQNVVSKHRYSRSRTPTFLNAKQPIPRYTIVYQKSKIKFTEG